MKGIVLSGAAALALGVSTYLYSSARPDLPGREARIKGGRTAISFVPDNLEHSKLKVEFTHAPDDDDCNACSLPGFRIERSDLSFRVLDGKLAGFDRGKASHKGKFKLAAAKKTFTADQISIAAEGGPEGGLNLTVDTPKGEIVAFELGTPRNLTRSDRKELVFQDMEVRISDELAYELGDPTLRGSSVGSITLYAEATPEDGEGDLDVEDYSPESAGIDVSLSAMGSLAVASNPVAKVGAYPNGRTGLTMSTTSCNVGSVNIPWNAPMQTTHPVIALNLYRLRDGKFEHVGWSWLKHGFLSTNSNGCGTCQHPGTGSLLGLNCSDTYGTGNNGDRTYLGARDEVNPFTGVWTCQGSWFSNYVNDCVRRNPGSVTLDAVDHRLDCLDSDLGNSGARYFYEAYYITPNDVNTYNNLGSREATITWNGSSWNITTTGTMVQGPAINRWGEIRSTAQPQTEGDVIVALQTTNLGNGMWRYDYALYNHNLDRQVRTFSVPLPYGSTVQNVGFRDIDRDANNGWTAVQNDDSITWSTPEFGQAGANPLKYSSVFNFRFDTNVPPASTTTTLGLHKPGTLQFLAAATRGPLVLDPPTSYSLINGSLRSGDLGSLARVDGDRLVLGPMDSGARSGTGISTSNYAPAGTISQIIVGVRSSNTLTTGGGATQNIELWNWTTSAYEVLDTRPATLADSTTQVTITTNAARFVDPVTGEVMARITHSSNLGLSGNRWTMAFDQVGIHFN